MKVNKKKLVHIFIIVSALVGVYRTLFLSGEPGDNDLLYFTIQSNIWVALIHLWLLLTNKRTRRTRLFRVLHYMVTVSITLTLIVFFAVLVPELGLYVVSLPGSILTHLVVPISAILYFIKVENTNDFNKIITLLGVVLPLIYMIMIFILSSMGITFVDDAPVPYFFLNYQLLGWFKFENGRMGVVYWIILLALLVIGIGMVLLKVNKRLNKTKTTVLD